MKLTVYRDPLLSAVRQCHLRGGHTGNPALGLVALTLTKILKAGAPDALALRASIGIVGRDIMVAAKAEEEGEFAIDCKTFRDAVTNMPDGELTLELKRLKSGAEQLVMKSGQRRWVGQVQKAAMVAMLPEPGPEARSIIVPAAELLTLIDRVRFVVDDIPEEKKGRLGVYLDVQDGSLSSVAWGDHVDVVHTPEPQPTLRLSHDRFTLLLTPIVIDMVRELALEKDSPAVELKYDLTPDGLPMFAWLLSSTGLVCFAPPIDPYPDWRTYLPQISFSPVCRLPRLAMLASLAALLATADETAMTRVELDQSTVELALDYTSKSAAREQPGVAIEFHDRVPVIDLLRQESLVFYVNAHFLRDAINAAGEDSVLHVEATGGAVVLTTDRGYKCIVSLISPPS